MQWLRQGRWLTLMHSGLWNGLLSRGRVGRRTKRRHRVLVLARALDRYAISSAQAMQGEEAGPRAAVSEKQLVSAGDVRCHRILEALEVDRQESPLALTATRGPDGIAREKVQVAP